MATLASEVTNLVIPVGILIISMALLSYISSFVIRWIENLIENTSLGETSAGFAVLSVITSTPELLVAIFSVAGGASTLSVGDLLGSNVFNLGMVVGLLMLGTGFLRECPEGMTEIADVLILSSIIPLVLVILRVSNPIIGVGLLLVFAFSVYREAKQKNQPSPLQGRNGGAISKSLTLLKIFIGTAVIVVSASFTVSSALNIAVAFGVAPILIGARLVSIGTSLPELSLTFAAVKRGRIRLATANAIGSNLSNLTLILGVVFVSSLFSPFVIDITSFTEIIVFVLLTSMIMWYHLTKGGDCRLIGILLILTYVVFQAVAATQ